MDSEIVKLVAQAKRGRQAAFTALYERTKDRAYYVAARYVSANDVSDMLQEGYTAAFGALSSFDDTKEFEPWLHTIIRNRCLDSLKKKRDVLTVDSDTGAELEDIEALVPNEWLEEQEKRKKIIAIVDSLPEYQRIAVVLFYFEGHTVAEIAEILSVPDGTVKSRLSNARKTIKEAVLMEERKGNKLYGVAGVPVLTKIFLREEQAAQIPAEISKNVLQGTLSSLSSSGVIAGVGVVAKFTALTIGAKVAVVSITAAAVVAGVGIPVYQNNQTPDAQPAMAVVDTSSSESSQAQEVEPPVQSSSVVEVVSSEPSNSDVAEVVASSEVANEAVASSDAVSSVPEQQVQTPQQTPPAQAKPQTPPAQAKPQTPPAQAKPGAVVGPQFSDNAQQDYEDMKEATGGKAGSMGEFLDLSPEEQQEVIAGLNW